MAPTKTDAILQKLSDLQSEQHATTLQVSDLVIHVKGNGGKGLHQRMNDLEEWREERPQVCPLSREETHKRHTREIALYGVIVAAVSLAVNLGWLLLTRGG